MVSAPPSAGVGLEMVAVQVPAPPAARAVVGTPDPSEVEVVAAVAEVAPVDDWVTAVVAGPELVPELVVLFPGWMTTATTNPTTAARARNHTRRYSGLGDPSPPPIHR